MPVYNNLSFNSFCEVDTLITASAKDIATWKSTADGNVNHSMCAGKKLGFVPPVYCDPTAKPPEFCPDGTPCPKCGQVQCACPRDRETETDGDKRRQTETNRENS